MSRTQKNLFSLTPTLRYFKEYRGDKPRNRPVITRTRSWRGIMQVRYDDTRADRQQFVRHMFVWAPMRVIATGMSISMFMYFYLGHDQYMYQMFGYESEAYLEMKRHTEPIHLPGDLIFNDRRAFRNIRENEEPTHEKRTFPIFREGVAERSVGEQPKAGVKGTRSGAQEQQPSLVQSNQS
jgi:hypothetical protein